MAEKKRDYIREGEESYQEFRDKFLADPENRRVYEEEASKLDLWRAAVKSQTD